MNEQTTAQDEPVQAIVPEEPGEFLLSLDEEEHVYHPHDVQELYFRVKHPGLAEDKIRAATFPIKMGGNRAVRRGKARVDHVEASGSWDPTAGFVAKCVYQITDYFIRGKKKDASEPLGYKVVDRKYNPANRGDNQENHEVYIALLQDVALREDFEVFLDEIAGRTDEGMEEQDALGEEQTP